MNICPEKIDILLAERGMTKKALATACGISAQSVTKITRRGTCTPLTAGRLAAGLGVRVADILKEAAES
ncbi:MAG: helix-turn-helix transcriptional regulator [Oscillibacter sp.]|nr:helix-turn-helix transcriptional regulator [Oscillibacter sp.]